MELGGVFAGGEGADNRGVFPRWEGGPVLSGAVKSDMSPPLAGSQHHAQTLPVP